MSTRKADILPYQDLQIPLHGHSGSFQMFAVVTASLWAFLKLPARLLIHRCILPP